MTNQAKANRLAALGKQEAQLMRQLARIQAERCKILCDGYTANAAAPILTLRPIRT